MNFEVSGNVNGSLTLNGTDEFRYEFTSNTEQPEPFTITYEAKALSGGNYEICNRLYQEVGEYREYADDVRTGQEDTDTCVFGYELDITKSIMTRSEFGMKYNPEYNTYREGIDDDGLVEL